MNEYTTEDYRFRVYRNPDGEQRYEIVRRSDGETVEDDLFDGDTVEFAVFVDHWTDADISEQGRPANWRCRRRTGAGSDFDRIAPHIPAECADPHALDDEPFVDADGTMYFDRDPQEGLREVPARSSLGERVLREVGGSCPPGALRLRRRDLVHVVARESDLDESTVSELIDAIDLAAEAGKRQGAPMILPGVPLADCLDRRDVVGEWTALKARPLVDHAEVLAALLRRSLDSVRGALDVLVEVIEAWPDDAAVFVPGLGYRGSDEALELVRRGYVLDELEYLERRGEPGRNAWMVQVAAEEWDVFDRKKRLGMFPEQIEVRRSMCDVAAGDVVVFSVVGAGARVHGIGDVVGESDDADATEGMCWVDMDFTIDLAEDPISDDDQRLEELLRAHPDHRLDDDERESAVDIYPLTAEALSRILQLARLRRCFRI